MTGAGGLWLDHASVAVADLREAVAELDEHLGLRATITPAAPHRHSRVHLDRTYLEVSSDGVPGPWRADLFFLRFDDPAALRNHLEAAGLGYRFDAYEGVDGRWDDVEVEGGDVPLPILVRRTHPPDVAASWPPPLLAPHRCGARTLEAVHVTVPDLRAAAHAYARLVGPHDVRQVDGDRPAVEVLLRRGRLVLTEGEGGLVLGVDSLARAAAVVGPLTDGPIGWLDPTVTHGLRLGFVEVPPLASNRQQP